MYNCSIRGNKARSGGGLAVRSFSEVNVNESSLNNNDAIQQGGGVFISDSSSIHFGDCNISYNVTLSRLFYRTRISRCWYIYKWFTFIFFRWRYF